MFYSAFETVFFTSIVVCLRTALRYLKSLSTGAAALLTGLAGDLVALFMPLGELCVSVLGTCNSFT